LPTGKHLPAKEPQWMINPPPKVCIGV